MLRVGHLRTVLAIAGDQEQRHVHRHRESEHRRDASGEDRHLGHGDQGSKHGQCAEDGDGGDDERERGCHRRSEEDEQQQDTDRQREQLRSDQVVVGGGDEIEPGGRESADLDRHPLGPLLAAQPLDHRFGGRLDLRVGPGDPRRDQAGRAVVGHDRIRSSGARSQGAAAPCRCLRDDAIRDGEEVGDIVRGRGGRRTEGGVFADQHDEVGCAADVFVEQPRRGLGLRSRHHVAAGGQLCGDAAPDRRARGDRDRGEHDDRKRSGGDRSSETTHHRADSVLGMAPARSVGEVSDGTSRSWWCTTSSKTSPTSRSA